MTRALGGSLLVILAVIAAGFIAQRLFGSSDADHPMSEAQEAIEAMPYGVAIHKAAPGVLVGKITGRNQVVHFAVAKSLHARGVPARLRRVDRNVLGGGPFWVWEDSETRLAHGTNQEFDDAGKLAVGIEEALCRKTTGEACPI